MRKGHVYSMLLLLDAEVASDLHLSMDSVGYGHLWNCRYGENGMCLWAIKWSIGKHLLFCLPSTPFLPPSRLILMVVAGAILYVPSQRIWDWAEKSEKSWLHSTILFICSSGPSALSLGFVRHHHLYNKFLFLLKLVHIGFLLLVHKSLNIPNTGETQCSKGQKK